ncbi:transcription factor FapR [Anaerobranca gottschalkii]|uniref:Acyl-coenzyme A thioesterase PaaI, contains HGG motif n=1 Tax=Anaerobranca gottschalkii DSM 13577 TaxID=1120990 RepID=A0A1H9YZ85_9FIRM|nr:transcription factor FapR [Anaerobranca gottschalkii]SES74418.1 Acyl-coenzyme A thioesterase PaaI, contains HGG motif [Anaerobranca gottschalkii DSM 13577]
MARGNKNKKLRHQSLLKLIEENPFLTDEKLAEKLGVSIQTIRLDRLELGISELRERTKSMAQEVYSELRSLNKQELVGDLLSLDLGKRAISLLQTTEAMAFQNNNIVRGHYIFGQANSLAVAVIDATVALTKEANIKYLKPVYGGERLVAVADVIKQDGNNFYVEVNTSSDDKQVFHGKFVIIQKGEVK